ncbi:MAG: hypothetical protein ACI9FN_002788 [Saprospiraceae bacterium]|jgi:hypothetical protein
MIFPFDICLEKIDEYHSIRQFKSMLASGEKKLLVTMVKKLK